MAYVCEICGKGISVGRNQKHRRGVAGRRWRKRAQKTVKVFSPNLQKKTLILNGVRKKVLICSRCLKKIKKEGKVDSYANVAVL